MANQSLVKRINRARVMNVIRRHSPISRSEIARLTSLDRKSMTNLVGELIAEGVVVEAGRRQIGKGRPLAILQFDRRAGLVLGIALAETKVVGQLINLYGEVLATREKSFPFDSPLNEVTGALESVYRELKQAAGETIAAVGLAAPGILDAESGLVHQSINIRCIEGKNIKQIVGTFVEEPLALEESSRAKALAEKWFGLAAGEPTFVCIDLGIGIGAGLVQNRRLYADGAAPIGEIGHTIVQRGGRRCRCGHLGCLEAYLSELVVVDEINRAVGAAFRELNEVPAVEEPMRPILQNAARRLGFALSYVVNLICPPLLVISGALVGEKFRDVVMPEILLGVEEGALAECLRRTRIAASELEHAAVLGAAARVLADRFEVEGHFYV